MNYYEELVMKSELATQNALRSESNWGRFFWSSVAEKLMIKALNLPICKGMSNGRN